MTMLEMSITYRAGAEVLRLRIRELRQARQRQSDPEEIFRLTRRIAELEPLLREAQLRPDPPAPVPSPATKASILLRGLPCPSAILPFLNLSYGVA